MDKIIQIAIDGPAGAGKSTIAKILAQRLNILYLDTGAMYRAITYYAGLKGVAGDDNEGLEKIFQDFDLRFENGKLFLNGKAVDQELRTPQIDKAIAVFAANPFVRAKLVAMQREIAAQRSVVMEGRDIGTVVLPDTPYKFYLDANVAVRAKRRFDQNVRRGMPADLAAIEKDILRRDDVDSHREADPLSVAEGSVVIDTSGMQLLEVVDEILRHIDRG